MLLSKRDSIDPAELLRRLDAARARLFLLLSWAVAVALIALVWLIGDRLTDTALSVAVWMVGTVAMAVIAATRLARCGRERLGVALVLGTIFVGVTVYVVGSGYGIYSRVLPYYVVPILFAGLLVNARVAAGFGAAACVAILAILLAQQNGHLLRFGVPPVSQLVTQAATVGVLVALATVIAILCASVLRSSLRAARLGQVRAESLLSIAADSYWGQDEDLRFTKLRDISGKYPLLPEADALGRRRWELVGVEPLAGSWDAHRDDLFARRPFRDLVMKRTHANGDLVVTSICGEPRFDSSGAFRGYWGVGRDVTAEHRARLALEESERRYRELFARSPSSLLVHRQGRILFGNAAAAHMFGVKSAAALAGLPVIGFIEPSVRAAARQRLEAIESEPVGTATSPLEVPVRRADWSQRVVESSMMRVQLDDGPATMSLSFDVTARKHAEQESARSQALLKALIDASPDLILVADVTSGQLLLANRTFFSALGMTPDDVIGRSMHELALIAEPEQSTSFLDELRCRGEVRGRPLLLRGPVSAPSATWMASVSAARFKLGAREYFVTNARDITAAEQLRLRYEATLNSASVGIAFTRDRRFVLVNPKFEQLFGWPQGSLLGSPGALVWPSETDYAEVSALVGPRLRAGESVEFERVMRRRDGSTFPGRVQACVVDPRRPVDGGTIWIVEDVTARVEHERALASARDEAQAANRAKSAFLANMSHEIRTPLNGVLGLARLAAARPLDAQRQHEYLRQLVESAELLTGVLNDVLDLSKIEAGRLEVERVEFDLHALLDSLAAVWSAAASEKGLRFAVENKTSSPRHVCGDPTRLRQVLGNFLNNAVKFTSHGGVTLRLEPRAAQHICFIVNDTGVGIDPQAQQRLFQPFVQADTTTTRRFGGTGLGLSICRELTRLMQGTLGVRSALGQGSSFWVELPLPPASSFARLPDGDETRELAGMRVLLVEDNPINALIAETMLANWGALVERATDGRAAIAAVDAAAASAQSFDAVLMDLHMPVMSGEQATRELRQRYDGSVLPIIALTAAALSSERQRCAELGMNGFITKPIDERQLRGVLQRLRKQAVA